MRMDTEQTWGWTGDRCEMDVGKDVGWTWSGNGDGHGSEH